MASLSEAPENAAGPVRETITFIGRGSSAATAGIRPASSTSGRQILRRFIRSLSLSNGRNGRKVFRIRPALHRLPLRERLDFARVDSPQQNRRAVRAPELIRLALADPCLRLHNHAILDPDQIRPIRYLVDVHLAPNDRSHDLLARGKALQRQ